MNQFLMEMHAHTSEVSPCGQVDAVSLVRAYKKAGYAGVVITDHFCDYTFLKTGKMTWQQKVDYLLRGYRTALEAGGKDFTVLLGIEARFPENDNDYLVYGIDEAFLRGHECFTDLSFPQFSALARENGLLVFQAHPFRNGMTVQKPQLLDGIEIYNGNKRHDSRNDIAAAWARKFGLLRVSGSDFHQDEDTARGGVYFPEKITSNAQMLRALQEEIGVKATD